MNLKNIKQTVYLCPPQPEGGQTFCFWCGSRRRQHQRLLLRALSSEPVDEFRPNLHRYIVGKRGSVGWNFVTLT